MMNATQKMNNRRLHDVVNTLINIPDSVIAKPIADLILDNCENHVDYDDYSIDESVMVVSRDKTIEDDILDGIKSYLHIDDDYKYPVRSKIKLHLNELLDIFNKFEYTEQPWDGRKVPKMNFFEFYTDIVDTNTEEQASMMIQDI